MATAPSRSSVNMREIARTAGVSITTVSNLLSGRANNIKISDATRARVLEVCQKLGYEPNIHAHRLFSKRSNILGIIFPSLQTHLLEKHVPDFGLAGIIQGIVSGAALSGYQVTLFSADEVFYRDKVYLRNYRNQAVDAMLIWGVRFNETYVTELHEAGVPFVLVQSKTAESERKQFNFVGADDLAGARQCTEHLISLGHKTIGYIRGYQTSSVGVERWIGYRKAMEQYNLFRDDLVVDGDYKCESGRRGAAQLLSKCKEITAIACANDEMALGAVQYLNDKGIKVPDDISVTGADVAPNIGKNLTSFGVSLFDIGAFAAEHVIKQISAKEQSNALCIQQVFRPEFHVGATSAPPRTNNY